MRGSRVASRALLPKKAGETASNELKFMEEDMQISTTARSAPACPELEPTSGLKAPRIVQQRRLELAALTQSKREEH